MPKGKRRKICRRTGKKPKFPRRRKNWKRISKHFNFIISKTKPEDFWKHLTK